MKIFNKGKLNTNNRELIKKINSSTNTIYKVPFEFYWNYDLTTERNLLNFIEAMVKYHNWEVINNDIMPEE